MAETAQQLYQRLLGSNDVLVLGDSNHDSAAIRQHVSSNVKSLRDNGVGYLAIEIPRDFQAQIDSYLNGADPNAIPPIFNSADQPRLKAYGDILKQCHAHKVKILCADVDVATVKRRGEADIDSTLASLLPVIGGGDKDAFERDRAKDDKTMVSYIMDKARSPHEGRSKIVFLVGSAHTLISEDKKRLGITQDVDDYFKEAGKKPVNILLRTDEDRRPAEAITLEKPNYTIKVPSGEVTEGVASTPPPLPPKTPEPTPTAAPQSQPVISAGASSEVANPPWYVRFMPVGLAALGGIGGLALGGGFSLTGILLAVGLAVAGGVGGLIGSGAIASNTNKNLPVIRIQPGQDCKLVKGNDGRVYCDVKATAGSEQRTVRLLGDVSINTGSSNGIATHSFALNRFMIPGMNDNIPSQPSGLSTSFFKLTGPNQDTLSIDAQTASRMDDHLNSATRPKATHTPSDAHNSAASPNTSAPPVVVPGGLPPKPVAAGRTP